MFDVIAFLIENFQDWETCPKQDDLGHLLAEAGFDGEDAQRLVVGGKYGFNKATTGHVYAGYINEDYANDESEDGFGIGTGIEYKF
jgi:predicted porin